jgi:hypothetical protein
MTEMRVGTTEFAFFCGVTPTGLPVYVIKDANRGGMTVTTNAANVLKAISEEFSLKLSDRAIIVYRDSEGQWDGISVKGGTFAGVYSLGAADEQEAISMAVTRHIKVMTGATKHIDIDTETR